jgi:ABC-type proline/glycine betaine transport system permease subunit
MTPFNTPRQVFDTFSLMVVFLLFAMQLQVPMCKLNAGNNVFTAANYPFLLHLQTPPCGNFC